MKPLFGGASRVLKGRPPLLDMITSRFVSPASPPPGATLPALNASFRRTLRAEAKSERTVKSYTEAVGLLADFLAGRGHPLTVNGVKRADVRDFIADQLDRWKPATALNRYRSLQAFFKWCVAEGELERSPMVGMKPPQLPDEPPPVLTDDLDLDDQVVIVLGKGRRQRAVPFGRKTTLAIDRYLRLRASHTFAYLPNLWVGARGAMTSSGLFQVVADRGASVGLPGLHPHQFRHSFADSWLSAGGNEGDLMASPAGSPARWSTATPSPPPNAAPAKPTAACPSATGSNVSVRWHRAPRAGPRQSRRLHQMPELPIAGIWLPAWTNAVAWHLATTRGTGASLAVPERPLTAHLGRSLSSADWSRLRSRAEPSGPRVDVRGYLTRFSYRATSKELPRQAST